MPSEDELPAQCIMFDRSYQKAPFYLRVAVDNGIDQVELIDSDGRPCVSLPGAVQVCIREGYDPWHYYEKGSGLNRIPRSIRRDPAAPVRKPRP